MSEQNNIQAWLKEHEIDDVEAFVPDMAGAARGKVMPAAKFSRATPTYLPTSLFFLTITGGYPDFEGFNAYDTDADLALRPDLATTRAMPWASDRSVQVIHDVCDRDGNLVRADWTCTSPVFEAPMNGYDLFTIESGKIARLEVVMKPEGED